MLRKEGCHLVFAPEVEEMYPEKDTRTFDFGSMDKVMEGKHRPGHFNGVAQIVTKLFDAVSPDKAYFGQKDFQQLAIIRRLVKTLDYPIEIIACPIIREADGLAMSSRNQLLDADHRKAAPLIYQTLLEAKKNIHKESIETISIRTENTINNNPFLELEYFRIVDTKTLRPIKEISVNTRATACIAVYAGNVRLIDNVDLIS
jgi:pantoate--beta-alanine ligase